MFSITDDYANIADDNIPDAINLLFVMTPFRIV
jgi:hypothetical protein